METSRIILGLWPIAGITTIGVTETDAKATIAAAIDCGITAFDTAFSYGYDGESDRLLGQCIAKQRERFTIIAKVGQHWSSQRTRLVDGSAKSLTEQAEASLKRIGTDYFDMLMLHSPDPNVPLRESANAIANLQSRGLCRKIGICNVTPTKQREFSEALTRQAGQPKQCDAIQCPLNLIQRDSLEHLIPQCQREQCDVYVFWTLMKGLLAGRITRDHSFEECDVRPSYDIFQGDARRRTHDVLDAMQVIADDLGCTIAQLSVGWSLSQNGVTAALVGARRPEQIVELASAGTLPGEIVAEIDRIVDAGATT